MTTGRKEEKGQRKRKRLDSLLPVTEIFGCVSAVFGPAFFLGKREVIKAKIE